MILKQLSITKKNHYSWSGSEKDPMQYEGEIEFVNEHGSIKLNLNHETSLKLLGVVAESLVESSKELATMLTTAVIDSIPEAPALEHKS